MKRVLIISTNAIGDTYLSMSAIPYINEKINNVKIDFIVAPNSIFLFSNNNINNINNIILANRNFRKIFELGFQLRKIEYDFVFSFFSGLVNSYLFMFSKSKNKGGFINFIKRKNWFDKDQIGFILNNWNTSRITWERKSNYLFRISKILQKFDISNEKIMKYKFHRNNNTSSKNTIVIHPFSSRVERSLSVAQLQLLVLYLLKKFQGITITIIGDEKIIQLKHKINSQIKYEITPSIERLLELINCTFFIGVDSFPLHIADAYDLNFVGLFSETNPHAVLCNFKKSILFSKKKLFLVRSEKLIQKLESFLT